MVAHCNLVPFIHVVVGLCQSQGIMELWVTASVETVKSDGRVAISAAVDASYMYDLHFEIWYTGHTAT